MNNGNQVIQFLHVQKDGRFRQCGCVPVRAGRRHFELHLTARSGNFDNYFSRQPLLTAT
jgi:hypothetical protein